MEFNNPLLGTWKYRSFYNLPTPADKLEQLLFGEGEIVITKADLEGLAGTASFGKGYEMSLRGWCGFGAPLTLRFQGIGTGELNRDWVYDYVGYFIPQWPHGVGQVAAFVGSVIRSAPYKDGTGEAGVVASFVAIKMS